MIHLFNRLAILLYAIAMISLIGCGGKSFDYHSDNEIPKGQGVFSGEDGTFSIYDSAASQSDQTKGAAEKEPAAPAKTTTTSEKDDFQKFQQWKKEQAEFEAFQQWKQSQEGSQAYHEFQEWKRWREYRRWQEQKRKSD